jgi:hypothetical protein
VAKLDIPHCLRLIKIKGANGFLDVAAHGIPVVALRKYVFGKALRAKAAFFLLGHFKNQLVHLAQTSAN